MGTVHVPKPREFVWEGKLSWDFPLLMISDSPLWKKKNYLNILLWNSLEWLGPGYAGSPILPGKLDRQEWSLLKVGRGVAECLQQLLVSLDAHRNLGGTHFSFRFPFSYAPWPSASTSSLAEAHLERGQQSIWVGGGRDFIIDFEKP